MPVCLVACLRAISIHVLTGELHRDGDDGNPAGMNGSSRVRGTPEGMVQQK